MLKNSSCKVRALEQSDWAKVEEWQRSRIDRSPYLGLVVSHPFVDISDVFKRTTVKSYIIESISGLPAGLIITDFERDADRNIAFYIDIIDENLMKEAAEGASVFINNLFNERNFLRVYTHVLDYQNKIEELLKKIGFKKEAVLREHHYHSGTYHDVSIYGLLKEEFSS